MSTRKPNHADAQLMLQLYDLRREVVMRESRGKMLRWVPKSFADVQELTNFEHPDNAAWRQVGSYFEMAFGMARHGIVPADFVAENNGEGLLLFAKMEPFLEEYRAHTSGSAFGNAEWLAKNSKWAKKRLELFRARLATMRDIPTVPKKKASTKKSKKPKQASKPA